MPVGTLTVRTDATIALGTGHVIRCLALAQAWQDRGGDVIFAMAESTPLLDQYLCLEDVAVANIECAPGSEQDAIQLAEIAHEHAAGWVILDGYHFGPDYQHALKENGLKLLLVDDAGSDGHYFADIILNQNLHANEDMYRDREAYSQLLLGPRFVMLRREFMPWRERKRSFPTFAKTILVTIGGSDPDGLTLPLIEAFATMADRRTWLTAIVGGSNPRFDAVHHATKELGPQVRLLTDVHDMAGIMAESDLAVICGGGTLWEALYMGCATLSYSRPGAQRQIVQMLGSAGAIVDLGPVEDFDRPRLRSAMDGLISSPKLRQSQAERGRALVDGLGTSRVLRDLTETFE